jgi:hypothetical protein
MEQVWAQARPVMKLTRYMTKEGYVTGLDDIFLQIADDKMLEFVQSLVSADKACRKKLGRCGGTHLQCHGCASCNMLLWPPDRCPSFEKEDAVVLELLRFFFAWLQYYWQARGLISQHAVCQFVGHVACGYHAAGYVHHCLLLCVSAEEARRRLQRVLDTARGENAQGKALMAAAVATMAETAADDSEMPKREKLVVGDCCTARWRLGNTEMARINVIVTWLMDF